MSRKTPVPFTPDFAVHPGELIHESLQEHGMSQAELSRKAGLSAKHISQIINARSGVGTIAAHRIESVLGISARVLIRMQADYDVTNGRTRTRH